MPREPVPDGTSQLSSAERRNGLHMAGLFLLCTFLFSWIPWLVMLPAYRGSGLDAPAWALALLMVGAYGPSLVSLTLTRTLEGRSAVRLLLGRLVAWRVGLRWWLAALLLPSLVTVGALVLVLLGGRGGELGEMVPSRALLIPVALLANVIFGPLAEELGWRGYLLPRLLERMGPWAASAVVGTVWTIWHTPLFWAPLGTTISGRPVTVPSVLGYWALLVCLSVFFTWIHIGSRGSVLLAVVFHLTFNVSIVLLLWPDRSDALDRPLELYSLLCWAGWIVLLRITGVLRLKMAE